MYKVLIVDDEIVICEGLQLLIDWESLGFYIPDYALNGVQAMEILGKSRYDIIITDIKMPEIDGIELIKRIKIEGYTPRIIILSGYKDFEYARTALVFQVKNYLLKPINEEILINTLKTLSCEIEEELKKKISDKNNITIIREKILQNVVKQDARNSLAQYQAEEMNLKLEYGSFTMCIIEVDEIIDEDYTESYEQVEGTDWIFIKNIANELLEKFSVGYAFELEMDRIGILFRRIMDESISLTSFVTEFFQSITDFCRGSVTIAYGNEVTNFKDIHTSYVNALKALDLKFFMGGNRIISFDEVEKLNTAMRVPFKWELDELLNSIRNMNLEGLELQIENFCQAVLNNKISVSMVYGIVANIFLKLANMVYEEGGNPNDIFGKQYYPEILHKVQTLEMLKKLLSHACLETSKYIAGIKGSGNSTIDAIKNYIMEHCIEDVNIKTVAKVFYMNQAYLGRLFRKLVGVSITDYINDCRIEYAAKLLRSDDTKVHEVCRVVGYKDMNYFYAQFKRRKGTTPSEFRKVCNRNEKV